MEHTLSIIIRSAGNRKEQILDAISSSFNQKNITTTVIVILNGPNVDIELFNTLKKMDNVIVEYHKEYVLPDATLRGRQLVQSDYFCYLDDDDKFLPDRLHGPCGILAHKSQIDCVACNGIFDTGTSQDLMFSDPITLEDDPLKKLFDQNWLASCGGIFRSSTVDEKYFNVPLKYFEWTMTAFLLSLDKNITYHHDPIFVVNDTAGSLSASSEYLEANPVFLQSLLSYPIPENIKNIIKQRRNTSFHTISETFLRQKKYKKAWAYHLKSLCSLQGLKYLPFTRYLLLP